MPLPTAIATTTTAPVQLNRTDALATETPVSGALETVHNKPSDTREPLPGGALAAAEAWSTLDDADKARIGMHRFAERYDVTGGAMRRHVKFDGSLKETPPLDPKRAKLADAPRIDCRGAAAARAWRALDDAAKLETTMEAFAKDHGLTEKGLRHFIDYSGKYSSNMRPYLSSTTEDHALRVESAPVATTLRSAANTYCRQNPGPIEPTRFVQFARENGVTDFRGLRSILSLKNGTIAALRMAPDREATSPKDHRGPKAAMAWRALAPEQRAAIPFKAFARANDIAAGTLSRYVDHAGEFKAPMQRFLGTATATVIEPATATGHEAPATPGDAMLHDEDPAITDAMLMAWRARMMSPL